MTDEVIFSKEIEKIIENIDSSKLSGKIGIKTHFGEEGNETYLNPKLVKAIYEKLISLDFEVALIECNVLYQGSRTDKKSHIETAKKHGFDFAPIDILDGQDGKEEIHLEIEKGRVGKGLQKYDSLVVLSHFKGHVAAGFGGAFKNLGMGLGSRAGKLAMHSDVSPSISSEKCIKCGDCIENCDVEAIRMAQNGAVIDSKICIGCAMCIAICKEKAVNIPWGGSTSKELQEKIVDYSSAIINRMNQRLVYINVLKNITEDCDCVGKPMQPMMEDVGILLSEDPVAIESASLDLVDEVSDGHFKEINSVDNRLKINYAERLNLGTRNYQLKVIK